MNNYYQWTTIDPWCCHNVVITNWQHHKVLALQRKQLYHGRMLLCIVQLGFWVRFVCYQGIVKLSGCKRKLTVLLICILYMCVFFVDVWMSVTHSEAVKSWLLFVQMLLTELSWPLISPRALSVSVCQNLSNPPLQPLITALEPGTTARELRRSEWACSTCCKMKKTCKQITYSRITESVRVLLYSVFMCDS